MNVRWVVQSNLLAENDVNSIREATNRIGAQFEPVQVVPFSHSIPSFTQDDRVNIYFGSTTFINAVNDALGSSDGVFFSRDAFLMDNYIKKWGAHMLNSDARLTTLKSFVAESHPNDGEWFIRPNADDKSFAGDVLTFGWIKEWVEKINRTVLAESHLWTDREPPLHENTPILVGPAYKVDKEWRNFIVDGKVISSSRYRENHVLSKSSHDIPDDMLDFVMDRAREYSPHRIFVMDVAMCGGEYFIIECGCMNSVGFYCADINAIVTNVSQAVINEK